MNHEEFEHKLRSHDPAGNLAGRDAAEQRELLEQAMSGQPVNIISISRWTKRRKAISAAAAALLVIGVGGPIISGATTTSPNRLVFGQSQSNMMADKSIAGADSRESAMVDYYMGYWGFYHYELSSSVIADLPTSAAAYKIVNISNIEERIQEIADVLGVKNLTKSEADEKIPTDSDSQTTVDNFYTENFYAWTEPGSASFSYYNGNVDPWRDCFKDAPAREDDPVDCEPISTNLYTEAEAKSAAKELLETLGFETSSLRFETYSNAYSTDVYVTEQVNGMDSPINYYISFVSNGDLYSIGGSLTKLVEVATYDLIDVQSAINRANEMTNRTIDLWNVTSGGGSKETEPGNTGSATAEDGDISEPSSPSDEPTKPIDEPSDEPTYIEEPGPQPIFEPMNVIVSKVELGYQMFWMEDQSVLWLPVVNFFGTIEVSEEVNQFGSIVAIVDSQIDLDSLYMSMGMVSPMSRSAMID